MFVRVFASEISCVNKILFSLSLLSLSLLSLSVQFVSKAIFQDAASKDGGRKHQFFVPQKLQGQLENTLMLIGKKREYLVFTE